MTPEGPATGDEAIDHQVGHPADHLRVAHSHHRRSRRHRSPTPYHIGYNHHHKTQTQHQPTVTWKTTHLN